VNVVPFPCWLSNVTVPSSASINRFTTAKPKPCPLALVVNNGVKSLALTSSGIPSPVSVTVMIALGSIFVADSCSVPPFCMACRALLTRFVRARLRKVGSVCRVVMSLRFIFSVIFFDRVIVWKMLDSRSERFTWVYSGFRGLA